MRVFSKRITLVLASAVLLSSGAVLWRAVASRAAGLTSGNAFTGMDATPHVEAPEMIRQVSFTGDGLDGVDMFNWWSDDNYNNVEDYYEADTGVTQIMAPEWDASLSKNQFALVPMNTAWHVKAAFQIPGTPSSVTAWADADIDGLSLNSESSPVYLTYNSTSGLWEGVFQVAAGSDTLNHYDVTWTWRVSVGSTIYDTPSSHSVSVGTLTKYSSTDYAEGPAPSPEMFAVGPVAPTQNDSRVDVLSFEHLLFAQAAPVGDDTTKKALVVFAPIVDNLSKKNAGLSPDQAPGEALAVVQARRETIMTNNLNFLNSFGGKYEFPSKTGGDVSAEILLIKKTGTCGNWRRLLALAARVELGAVEFAKVIQRHPVVDKSTVPAVGPPTWSNYAECFETVGVTPQGGAAGHKFVYGDHAFVEYQGKCYDPSFTIKWNGAWDDYMRNKVIGRLAIPDMAIPAGAAGWKQCPASGDGAGAHGAPVLFTTFGAGGNVLELYDDFDTTVPAPAHKTWALN